MQYCECVALRRPPRSPSSVFFSRDATPAASIASFEALQSCPEPLSGLKDPASDPIFFTDSRMRTDIDAFWGNPAGSDKFTSSGNEVYHPCKVEVSYNNADDFIPRYDSAADDVKVFQEHGEHVVQHKEKGKKSKGEREMHEKELQQMREDLERLRNDGDDAMPGTLHLDSLHTLHSPFLPMALFLTYLSVTNSVSLHLTLRPPPHTPLHDSTSSTLAQLYSLASAVPSLVFSTSPDLSLQRCTPSRILDLQ
jgi:hypothetical protein